MYCLLILRVEECTEDSESIYIYKDFFSVCYIATLWYNSLDYFLQKRFKSRGTCLYSKTRFASVSSLLGEQCKSHKTYFIVWREILKKSKIFKAQIPTFNPNPYRKEEERHNLTNKILIPPVIYKKLICISIVIIEQIVKLYLLITKSIFYTINV